MKTIQIAFCFFLCLTIYVPDAKAQLIQIASFETLPERPTRYDTLKIAVVIVVNGSTRPHSIEHVVTDDTIDIRGCYQGGPAAILTNYTDTLTIGQMQDRLYYLKITAYEAQPNGCINKADSLQLDTTIRIHPQPFIDSITILPANPTTDDEVTVVTHASTTRPGKKLSLGYYTNISSGDIYATGCYAITDSFLLDEQYNDTLKLGKLRGGDHNFNFKAYLSDDTSVCGNRVDSSMMSKAFHVQPLMSAGSVALDKMLSIYPNPGSNTLYVRKHALVDIQSVQIRDMQGRIAVSQQDDNSVDVSQLPKGLYFVQVVTDKGAASLKFVKE